MSVFEKTFPDLPDWTFDVKEVSACVWRVRGIDRAGRSVERTGTDMDEVLDQCRKKAAEIRARSLGGRGAR